jgi:DNA-damage-inducible protein D
LRKSQTSTQAAVAYGAGVLTSQDFGIFQDHGYRGLYDGETAADIKARKGLKKSQHILDHMGTDELAANLFRASMTKQKLANDPTITTKERANDTHHGMGAAVRNFIIEQGGTPPEQLPTPDVSIRELQRREQKRLAAAEQAERQPSLFDDASDEDASGSAG